MENNRKGSGIFYGVIGVATLIITIIGATFAYFSASTNSAEDAITAQGAELTLGFSEENGGLKTDLIPIAPSLEGFNEGVVGIAEDKCKDANGNNICSVYQFTISNTATVSQRVFGTIVPKTNDFTNLRLAVFKGTSAEVDATYAGDANGVGWDVDGTPVTAFTTDWEDTSDANYTYTKSAADASRKHVIGNKGDLVYKTDGNLTTAALTVSAFEQVLDPNEAMTYTIVLWINETGSNQDVDQKKSFAGGVNFTTEGNGTGVTGVLATNS